MLRLAPASFALFTAFTIGCAPAAIQRPSAQISIDPSAPEDVRDEAERIDRACSQKETQLVFDYQEGKEEQEEFKTIMGSVTGGVGTAGGVAGGVGAFVASEEDIKTITGITGFVSAGLGAAGAVVTAVATPGKQKMEGSQQSLTSIEAKKANARKALEGKTEWSEADRAEWAKARADLEAACK